MSDAEQNQGIYPPLTAGCLLAEPFPQSFADDMKEANAEMFAATICNIN